MERMIDPSTHLLNVKSASAPDWERARLRLSLLSDSQIREAVVAACLHDHGRPDSPDLDLPAEELRSALQQALEGVAEMVNSEPGDDVYMSFQADAGYWDGDWHRQLFVLAMLGLLQAAGMQVEGYNIPGFTSSDPVDFWPAEGISLIWDPTPFLPEDYFQESTQG